MYATSHLVMFVEYYAAAASDGVGMMSISGDLAP
jgi:hypothetical protein